MTLQTYLESFSQAVMMTDNYCKMTRLCLDVKMIWHDIWPPPHYVVWIVKWSDSVWHFTWTWFFKYCTEFDESAPYRCLYFDATRPNYSLHLRILKLYSVQQWIGVQCLKSQIIVWKGCYPATWFNNIYSILFPIGGDILCVIWSWL